MTAIRSAWTDPGSTPLDFIVVGAGAAGAPLAARLVERGYEVLVVEMGPTKPSLPKDAAVENTTVPLLHTETTEDPRYSLRFFVKHFDHDPAKSQDPKTYKGHLQDDEGVFYPRAQGIGGCTVHNAMITVCGPSEDWDEIAEATGDESWRGPHMRAYFERFERCGYDRPTLWSRLVGLLGFGTGWENARHGHRGWLDTTMADLRFLTGDRNLLKSVLDGVAEGLDAGVFRLGEALRAVLHGRTFPSLDPNHWDNVRKHREGVYRIPCSITPTGDRSGPRERLLALQDPQGPHAARLHLLTGALVTELVLKDESNLGTVGGKVAACRAVGVRCLPRERVYEAVQDPVDPGSGWRGEQVAIYCRREVILCGGAFNTPQLLMLSGIGPADHLNDPALNPDGRIKVRVDLPGVGSNLQDRYEIPVVATVKNPFQSLAGLGLTSAAPPDRALKQWIDDAGKPAFDRGLYATNGGLVSLIVRSRQEDSSPDLFIFALAGYFAGYAVDYSRPGSLVGLGSKATRVQVAEEPRRKLTWVILKARTHHHGGTVRLRSDSPFRRPDINFRSFPLAPDASLEPRPDGSFPASEDQDLEALHEGIQMVRKIVRIGKDTGVVEKSEDKDELPGFEAFHGNVRKWIKHTAWGHHACGTCRIGSDDDDDAVVDSRLRVRGVRGLRVVDASVFPRIPGFFIVSHIYTIAEKAADMLSEDHPLPQIPPEAKKARQRDPVLPSSASRAARLTYPAEMEEAEAQLVAARRRAAGV